MNNPLSTAVPRTRGRKPRNRVDVCQAAYWAWWVRTQLGMDFSKIERLLNPECFERRDDIGGYKQPQLWRKYGLGQVSPIGNGRNNRNAVQQAEEICTGSSEVYQSVLWDLLRIKDPSEEQLHEIAFKLPNSLKRKLSRHSKCFDNPWACIRQLSKTRINQLATRPDLSILAMLLMLIQSKSNILERLELAALTTWWLNHAVLLDLPFKAVAHLLIPLLEEYQPDLGDLKQFISITHALPESSHLDNAFKWIYFGKDFLVHRHLTDPFTFPHTFNHLK